MFTTVVLLICSICAGAFAHLSWPEYGGSNLHTGYKREALSAEVVGFKSLWNSSSSGDLSSPVAQNGLIYASTQAGVVYVIDESTGKRLNLWNLGQKQSTGAPTVGNSKDQVVYVVADESVFALDAMNLRVKWSTVIDPKWSNNFSPSSSLLGVGVSKLRSEIYVPYGNSIITLNSKDGSKLNEIRFLNATFNDNELAAWVPTVYPFSSTVERLNFIYEQLDMGNPGFLGVGELQPGSGKAQWAHNYSSPLTRRQLAVIRSGDLLVTAAQSYLIAYNVSGGSIKKAAVWTSDNAACDVELTPASDGTYLYRACDNAVLIHDLKTGADVGKYEPCEDCYGQPIVTDDLVIAKSTGTGVYVFQKHTRKLIANLLHSDTFLYIEGLAYGNGLLVGTANGPQFDGSKFVFAFQAITNSTLI